MRPRSRGRNSRLERVRVSYSPNCIDNPAYLAGRPIMGMIKDGRSQRWSLADNLRADAANGKKAAHGGDKWGPNALRQGHGHVEGLGKPLKPPLIPSTHCYNRRGRQTKT